MTNSYNYSHRKLTDLEVEEIRRRYSTLLNVTQRQLAKEYNVSEACIQRIIGNKSYNYPTYNTFQEFGRQAP